MTDAAVDDLERLDGSALVWALKKMLLLEADPYTGEPLVGTLIGYRKLVVGNRDWRLVWRVTTEERGRLVVEIAEVWAVGARSDGAVYDEMAARIAAMPDGPARRSMHSVLEQLGRRAKGVQARVPREPVTGPEPWLVDRLVHSAGRDRREVEAMTSQQAVDAWTDFMMRSR